MANSTTGLQTIASLLSYTLSATTKSNNTGLLNSGKIGSALQSYYSEKNTKAAEAALKNRQSFSTSEFNLFKATGDFLDKVSASSLTSGVTSADTTKVTATAKTGASAGTYNIEISQLAKAQVVTGDQKTAAAATGITTAGGYGQLEFDVNGKRTAVTYQLNGTETEQQAMQKIAQAVNARTGLGITAAVDVSNGKASLKLSGQSGTTAGFTVTDTVGNAASYTGISDTGNITQAAQNAKFSINGTAYESAGNTANMTSIGLSLELGGTTTEAVKVEVAAKAATAVSDIETGVRNLVKSYNTAISELSGNSYLDAQKSTKTMIDIAKASRSALSGIGIEVGANGALTINETKFAETVANSPGDIISALTGKSGFVTKINTAAETGLNKVLNNPISTTLTSASLSGSYDASSINQIISANLGTFFNTLT